MSDPPPPRRGISDVERHQRRTERNLVLGGFALAFLLGGLLIWRFYGLGAMFAGWACLAGGLSIFGLLYGILKLMELWSNARRDD
jgi:hypothetical protein